MYILPICLAVTLYWCFSLLIEMLKCQCTYFHNVTYFVWLATTYHFLLTDHSVRVYHQAIFSSQYCVLFTSLKNLKFEALFEAFVTFDLCVWACEIQYYIMFSWIIACCTDLSSFPTQQGPFWNIAAASIDKISNILFNFQWLTLFVDYCMYWRLYSFSNSYMEFKYNTSCVDLSMIRVGPWWCIDYLNSNDYLSTDTTRFDFKENISNDFVNDRCEINLLFIHLWNVMRH